MDTNITKAEKIKTILAIVGTKEELNTIYEAFKQLKSELATNRVELYKEALLWIVTNEEIKKQFIKHILNKKIKNLLG